MRPTIILTIWYSGLCMNGVKAQELLANVNNSAGIHSIMLIPYDPLYYISDADHDIAEQSNVDMKDVRKAFHQWSDYFTFSALARNYKCIDLLHDSSIAAQEDLITVISTLGYKYEDPMQISPDPNLEKFKTDVKKKTTTENVYNASKYKTIQGDLKYMNAVLSKPEILSVLSKKYEVEYFVFLNQFEIKTNFNSCIDISNRIYQRTVLLHYSVYDTSGKQIAGNFAYSFFPSNSSDANEIINNCFKELGEGISKNLTNALFSGAVKK